MARVHHVSTSAEQTRVTASFGRRVVALLVDWIACTLVTIAILSPAGWSNSSTSGFWTTGIFVLESALFTALLGGSFGKLATRLRVVRWPGAVGNIDLLRATVRAILVVLVIPPLVFRPDGRGLHDMAAGSGVVPLRPAA